jgi:hypothetical protein
LRFLALFGFLVGEAAMVVYSAQSIKVGARHAGARPRSSDGRVGWRAGGKASATATAASFRRGRAEHRSNDPRAEIFAHHVTIRQQQRCAPSAI